MREMKIGGFAERLENQAEARKALLAKFKPKPMIAAEVLETRAQKKARELAEVRRVAEKEEAHLAAEAAAHAAKLAYENDEQAQLDAKRNERKDRKSAAKAEARAKREAKSAARRR
jgi:Family of unknown function (DUF6481)